jgi:hypothetical protein
VLEAAWSCFDVGSFWNCCTGHDERYAEWPMAVILHNRMSKVNAFWHGKGSIVMLLCASHPFIAPLFRDSQREHTASCKKNAISAVSKLRIPRGVWRVHFRACGRVSWEFWTCEVMQ